MFITMNYIYALYDSPINKLTIKTYDCHNKSMNVLVLD